MTQPFAAISPDIIFTGGLLLVAWFVLRWSRNRPGGKRRDHRFADDGSIGAPQDRPRTPPASLDQWEVRMHELARDLSAQLDTKIRIVQQLVLRAEQQSARLEAAIDRAQRLLEQDEASPAGSTNVPAAPGSSATSTSRQR